MVYSARHQHRAGESPAEFSVGFTCLEAGSASDKQADEIQGWCGEKHGEGKNKKVLL